MGTESEIKTKLTRNCLCIFHGNTSSGVYRIFSFRRHYQYVVIYISNN